VSSYGVGKLRNNKTRKREMRKKTMSSYGVGKLRNNKTRKREMRKKTMSSYGVGKLRNNKQEGGRLEKEDYEQIWSWKFEKQQTRKREIRERKL
jgi:hypothetical protein